MTTATCGVAEEQLAVEIQDAQKIPEKVHRFFFHHRCAEPACEWRHNEPAVPQQKERVVARGTSRNNLYGYCDSVSVLSHCFRVVVKLLRESIAVQLLFFLASSFCGWCGASLSCTGEVISFRPLFVTRCCRRSCLGLHSDALVLNTSNANRQSRT